MAIDQALLEESDRTGRAFLRLYRWTPPCLSFGRNEPALARYDRAAIERLGLDVVRRPTGGRAVWHHDEVTYAVTGPVDGFGSLRSSYRVIHGWLARALRCLGVAAQLAGPPTPPSSSPAPGHRGPRETGGPCFAQAVGGEVVAGGRKLIGSAQLRQGTAFLQHGSILLNGTQQLVNRVSRRPGPAPNATTLAEVLGREVRFHEVGEAIIRVWEGGAQHAALLQCTAIPPYRRTAFSDPAWTWRR